MQTQPHNPEYRLVSRWLIPTGGSNVELVYGEMNDGTNKGLEVYFYVDGEDNHYYSRRYDFDKIPAKYHYYLQGLLRHVSECPAGHKLSL